MRWEDDQNMSYLILKIDLRVTCKASFTLYLSDILNIVKYRTITTLSYFVSIVFYPFARWARRGIVVPFVRRRLRRRLHRRRTHSFGYYTSMVQQIKFIIHTNIQPLLALFFTQGHRS